MCCDLELNAQPFAVWEDAVNKLGHLARATGPPDQGSLSSFKTLPPKAFYMGTHSSQPLPGDLQYFWPAVKRLLEEEITMG